jgi:hypothetical protein
LQILKRTRRAEGMARPVFLRPCFADPNLAQP